MQQRNLKPILKWAGGKTQLLAEISHAYPDGFGDTIRRYAEPFVGGGAVLFDILSKFELDEVYISDVNAELINMYLVVRDQAEALISLLTEYQTEYLALDDEGRKQYYYGKRDEFNNLIVTGESKSGIKSAALFIFLNRTCFNGLYRANRNGLFNVPKGDQANPLICNEENIRAVSAALLHLMESFDAEFTSEYMSTELLNDENVLRYIEGSVSRWIGSGVSYEVSNEYTKYLTKERVLQAIQNQKENRNMYELPQEVQYASVAFFLHETEGRKNHFELSQQAIKETLQQWQNLSTDA